MTMFLKALRWSSTI